MMDAIKTGKIIRDARAERGLTQQALADALHLSATAVSKWENGHSLPDIALLEPLSAALGVSISDLVVGERSHTSMEQTTENSLQEANEQELAVKSVLRESVRQRKRGIFKWVAVALCAACAVTACVLFLFVFGGKAKQSDIRATTEIQEGWNGNPEWVIHFETANGRPLYPYTEEASMAVDGERSVNGRIIHLRVAPLGHANPSRYTWGYSVEGGLAPTDTYDFFVTVDYADGAVTYSMRDEGLFG